MVAAKYNFVIEQGATFAKSVALESTYPTPVSARLMARTSLTSTAPVISLTSTSTSGGITINTETNTINLLISATTTAAYNFDELVYDLELVYASSVERLLEGKINLSKEVPHD